MLIATHRHTDSLAKIVFDIVRSSIDAILASALVIGGIDLSANEKSSCSTTQGCRIISDRTVELSFRRSRSTDEVVRYGGVVALGLTP